MHYIRTFYRTESQLRRSLVLVCFLVFGIGQLPAQVETAAPAPATNPSASAESAPKSGSEFGSVSGQVSDSNSGLALSGVQVTVVGTTFETSTDTEGNYRFAYLPVGIATLNFSYVGYPAKTVNVTVVAGQPAQLNAKLGDEVVQMSEFKITDDEVGTARSINLERNAPALLDIVAADAIGQLPDKNVAEALERAPGIDLYRDKGEGRFVEIRGIDPVYIGVSFNGMPASTTEKGTREVTLDVIESDMISSLEINKVALPEYEGEMVGGSVDIQTRSGLDQQGAQALVSVGTNFSTQEDRHGGYNLAGYYGNQYDNGKVGVFIGVMDEDRPFTVYNTEEVDPWELVKSPTDGLQHWLFGGQDFRHYDVNRQRHGLDGSLDYKFDNTSKLYFRYTMSYYTERDYYWVTEVPFQSYSSLLALNDTSAEAVIPAKDLLKENVGVVNGKISTSLVGGYDKTFGQFTDNAEVGYTIGKYTRPTTNIAFANTSAMTMSYAFSDPWHDTYFQNAGQNFNDPSQYAFSTKSSFTNTQAGQHVKSVKDSLKDDLDLNGVPAFIKIGAEYSNTNAYEQAWKDSVTAAPYTFASLATPDTQYQWGGFASPRLPVSAIQDFYENPSSFPVTETVSTTDLGSYQVVENVSSAFAEAGVTLGKLKITAGARLEGTDFWIQGWQSETNAAGVTYSQVAYTHNYANLLPDVVFTYNLDPHTIARASWTNTLARPDYADTIPGRTIDDINHLVTQGNPAIDALRATNYDLSLEHYYSSLGAVQAAVFYKSINNFPFQAQSGIDPTTGYLLTTYYTAPSAWIYGVELNARQRFGFLPAPLDGLGINANATFGNSQVQYPTRPGEDLQFIGYAKIYGNISLTYQKGGLSADLALNHHSPRLEVDSSIGANATQDTYEDAFTELDASISYTYHEHWHIYANASNLNNAPLREYYGGTPFKHLAQYEQYGPGFETGVKWTY